MADKVGEKVGGPEEETNNRYSDEIKEALKIGASLSLKKGLPIPGHVLERVALEELKDSITTEAAKEGVFLCKKNNYDIPPEYAKLSDKTTISEVKKQWETPEKLRETAKKSIESFFNTPGPAHNEIAQVIESKSLEELEKIFKRPLLPSGVKIHLDKQSPFSKFLERSKLLEQTKGFVAQTNPGETKRTCFIANPVANIFILEMCWEVLDKVKQREGITDDDSNITYQACVPHRLPDKECGIANIAYLLSKKEGLNFDPSYFDHSPSMYGMTIPSAGNVVSMRHNVATKEGFFNPFFANRTDIVLCFNLDDIKKAHFILSLLASATYKEADLRYKQLGLKFINDMTALVEQDTSGCANLLSSGIRYIEPKTQKEKDALHDALIKITNARKKATELSSRGNKKPPLVKDTLTMQVRELVKEYYSAVYADPKMPDLRDIWK